MSNAGKLRRGKRFYSERDLDGNLPKWITENESRLSDLDCYLRSLTPKPSAKETKSKGKK